MRIKLKYFLIGIFLSSLLLFTGTAFAENVLPQISTACEKRNGDLYSVNDGWNRQKVCDHDDRKVIFIGIGSQGPKGDKGDKGEKGDQGLAGINGSTGATGPQGLLGPTGPRGATGIQGSTGITGPTGSTGPKGSLGATGATGSKGEKGDAGPQGPPGTAVESGRKIVDFGQVRGSGLDIEAPTTNMKVPGEITVNCPNGCHLWVNYDVDTRNTTTAGAPPNGFNHLYHIYIDGIDQAVYNQVSASVPNAAYPVAVNGVFPVSAGSHTVSIYVKVTGGHLQQFTSHLQVLAIE